jgi:hypothetical protein
MNTDGSIDLHANFLPAIHAPIPPSSILRTDPQTPSRSDHRVVIFRQGLGTLYRLLSGEWDDVGFLGWAVQGVLV